MNLGFFSIVFALFHLLHHLSAQAANSALISTCPEHFECGNLGRMAFPFANFSQPHCVLCMLNCEAQPSPTIILKPSSGQFFFAISKSESNIIQIYDPTLQKLLQNYNVCASLLFGITLPNSPSISFTIKSNITLFRCTKNPKIIPEVANYFNTNHYRKIESCPEFDLYYRNSRCYNYSLEREFSLPGCSPIHFPIRKNASENTELFQLVTADFDLEWHLADKCYHDCHLKGGRCETGEMNEFSCAGATIGTQNLTQNAEKNKPKIIVITVSGIALLVILVYFIRRKFSVCISMEIWKCKTDKNQDIETFLKNCGSLAPKRYRYTDVKKITNSFKVELGQGGYGSVYRGTKQDGSLVAVKVLKESKGHGEEFINEVASISRTSHVNMVTLLSRWCKHCQSCSFESIGWFVVWSCLEDANRLGTSMHNIDAVGF